METVKTLAGQMAGKQRAVRLSLLYGTTRSLRRRRRMATLSALALGDAALVTLSQLGVVRHLPDPPLKRFDSSGITRSRPAYVLGVPDAALAACSYAGNLVLTSIGGTSRIGRSKTWSSLLLLNCVASGIGAVGYLAEMLFRQRRLCGYCLTAIGINVALVPMALREWREAHGH